MCFEAPCAFHVWWPWPEVYYSHRPHTARRGARSARHAFAFAANADTAMWSIEDAEVKAACKNVAVLFDFDGTLGDTETPAMEVAFWELAPYFAGAWACCTGWGCAFGVPASRE